VVVSGAYPRLVSYFDLKKADAQIPEVERDGPG
jgi:hypothetical protein